LNFLVNVKINFQMNLLKYFIQTKQKSIEKHLFLFIDPEVIDFHRILRPFFGLRGGHPRLGAEITPDCNVEDPEEGLIKRSPVMVVWVRPLMGPHVSVDIYFEDLLSVEIKSHFVFFPLEAIRMEVSAQVFTHIFLATTAPDIIGPGATVMDSTLCYGVPFPSHFHYINFTAGSPLLQNFHDRNYLDRN
jgi:hypothetical protein